MKYIKNGAVAEDGWTRVADDAAIPADIPVILSGARLLAANEGSLAPRTAPLGVIWPNREPVIALAPWLPRLALIALVFPVFKDGRAYSQARQLRERHGYKGELRATGDVLRDQFQFMLRAGFDAFEVRKDEDADNFAQAAREFSLLYQPAANGSPFRARIPLRSAANGKDRAHV